MIVIENITGKRPQRILGAAFISQTTAVAHTSVL